MAPQAAQRRAGAQERRVGAQGGGPLPGQRVVLAGLPRGQETAEAEARTALARASRDMKMAQQSLQASTPDSCRADGCDWALTMPRRHPACRAAMPRLCCAGRTLKGASSNVAAYNAYARRSAARTVRSVGSTSGLGRPVGGTPSSPDACPRGGGPARPARGQQRRGRTDSDARCLPPPCSPAKMPPTVAPISIPWSASPKPIEPLLHAGLALDRRRPSGTVPADPDTLPSWS